mgnify:CR=1 FL=1
MVEEQWRTCVYDGETWDEYEVSTKGRVRSLNYYRVKGQVQLLKLIEDGDSYLLVNLYYKGEKKRKLCKVHRLVAFAFIENDDVENKNDVNHINELRHDNRVENLEWMTHKENINYGNHTERMAKTKCKKIMGKSLMENKVIVFKSIAQAEKFGFDASNICKCCKGKLKQYKNYVWNYIN